MASWTEFKTAAPELAERMERRFAAHKHKMLATLRRDGSPRITGCEIQLTLGEMWLGMMGGSLKARDLQRDPRFALHAAPDTAELGEGDAKVAGLAVEVTDQATIDAWAGGLEQEAPGPFHLFRVDVREASLVAVEGDHLAIDVWKEGEGVRRIERK